MKVQKLRLSQFRNIQEAEFKPDPQINLLVGKNGQGKTSVLEALSFLATLRSFRDAKTAEVLNWGKPAAEVEALIATTESNPSQRWESKLQVLFQTNFEGTTSKTALINGKPFKSSTQYLAQRFGSFELGFHTVVFNPADHSLVQGDPSERRGYLDRVLAAESIGHLELCRKYQRVLEQRNALLRQEKMIPKSAFEGFTEALIQYGSQIALNRTQWLDALNYNIAEMVRRIAPLQASVAAKYQSKWLVSTGQELTASLELFKQYFSKKCAELGPLERHARTTLSGPHRDDWGFTFGGQPLKGHGSQGEIRSVLLGLKTFEIESFRKQTGHLPLFLLDDFSSELDAERRGYLLRYLRDTDLQVFVTTTDEDLSFGKKFRVSQGQVVET